jgi:hypothetical protein
MRDSRQRLNGNFRNLSWSMTRFRFDSGYEVCVYEFQHGIPRFVVYVPIAGLFSSHTRRTGKEVRILFDPAGIVQKYLVLDITVKPDGAQMPAD